MTAFFKTPTHAVAVARPASISSGAPSDAARVPTAVLAHGTSDRLRIRVEGRQADLFLELAAAELAWHPDILRIRVNRGACSLTLWARDGSELADGTAAVALVSEILRRIALGERRGPAPIETSDGLGLSHVLGPAKLLLGAG